jgi:hypothetical protein
MAQRCSEPSSGHLPKNEKPIAMTYRRLCGGFDMIRRWDKASTIVCTISHYTDCGRDVNRDGRRTANPMGRLL